MRRVLRLVIRLVAIALIGLAVFWWIARPDRPDSFYRPAAGTPTAAPPGTLLAQEEVLRLALPGSRGWRILYATTRPDGTPATASAVVVVPDAAGPVPVIAYAHGTTGVRPGCAPSVFDNPFPNVPGFPALLDQGWAYVATDYVGLGTEGGHFYLVGQDAGRAVLDSIRAARQIDGIALSDRVAVWGHSQGGHSALWAGQLAPGYAPELKIAGVAAISPASNLPALVAAAGQGPFGKIVAAYLIDGYARAYPATDAWSYVSPLLRPLVRDIASRCIEMPDALLSIAETRLIPAQTAFRHDPTTGPLGERLAENVPQGPFAMPVLIAQGAADDLVLPQIQDGFAAQLCAAGQPVDYRRYVGQDHVSVVQPESPLTADLIGWTRDRLADRPAARHCPP